MASRLTCRHVHCMSDVSPLTSYTLQRSLQDDYRWAAVPCLNVKGAD